MEQLLTVCSHPCSSLYLFYCCNCSKFEHYSVFYLTPDCTIDTCCYSFRQSEITSRFLSHNV